MYKETKSKTEIIRISDGATIPIDPKNTDYKEYLKYVGEGGVTHPEKTQAEIDEAAVIENNEKIKAELLQADLLIIRAIVENNKQRIDEFKLEQSARRKKLVPPGE